MSDNPYGYCPKCGAPGVIRERRPDGNDRCANGHTYPSRASLAQPQAAQPDAAAQAQTEAANWKRWCEEAERTCAGNALSWAVDRWNDEVKYRPLVNKNRRALDDTWRQVMRRFGGDPDQLVGPSHDALLATPPTEPAPPQPKGLSVDDLISRMTDSRTTFVDGAGQNQLGGVYRKELRDALQAMILSAVQIVDGETVVGYRIKTGALHKLVGMNQDGDDGVFFPSNLPSEPAPQDTQPNNDEVICPKCVHQFRAIPENVQRLMLDAGFEPPFNKPAPQAEPAAVGELPPLTNKMILDAATKEFPDWREDIQEQFVLRVVRAALALAPHAREPLSEQQIDSMWEEERARSADMSLKRQWLRFARAVERAHGIG